MLRMLGLAAMALWLFAIDRMRTLKFGRRRRAIR